MKFTDFAAERIDILDDLKMRLNFDLTPFQL